MDIQTGEQLLNQEVHEYDYQINDMQFSADRTYFLTAGKDKTAKVGGFCMCSWSVPKLTYHFYFSLFQLGISQ